jgi:hypothetical protein
VIDSPCEPKGPDFENAGTCKETDNTDCLEEEEVAGGGIEPLILVSKALAETIVGAAMVEGVHNLAGADGVDHGEGIDNLEAVEGEVHGELAAVRKV